MRSSQTPNSGLSPKERSGRRATATQERLWLLDQLHPSSPVCNEAIVLWLEGPLDRARLRAALDLLVAGHDALRASFVERARALYVHVATAVVPFRLHEAPLDAAAPNVQLTRFAQQPFDLERAPLFRAGLFRASADRHALVLASHRAAVGELSLSEVIPRLLGALYQTGTRVESASHDEFLERARAASTGEQAACDLQYWRALLEGAPRALSLPTDRRYPPRPSMRGHDVEASIDRGLRERLEALAAKLDVRPSDVACAAFAAQLMRYAGQTDVVIGIPADLRSSQNERMNLIGCCTGTALMRARFDAAPSFEQLVCELSSQRRSAEAHLSLPFGSLVEALDGGRDSARHPLFQAMFVEVGGQSKGLSFGDLSVRVERPPLGVTALDLTLELAECASGYRLVLVGNADVFAPDHLARMLTHFSVLLRHAVESPQAPIDALHMVGPDELETLRAFARGPRPSRQLQPFHVELWQRAQAFKGSIALRCGTVALDYEGLFQRAIELANRLIEAGVAPGELVLVPALNDPIDTVVGMLGVLAAGGAFVPLDSEAPPARRRMVVEDSSARFVLSERDGAGEALAELPTSIARVPVRSAGEGEAPSPRGLPEVAGLTADQPAYLLYTSGSTGVPKGVVVSHKNLTHQLHARLVRYDDPPGRALAPYSFAFDSALASLSWTLATGGVLHLLNATERHDLDCIEATLAREEISHLDAVPSLYAALLSRARPGSLPALRVVVCGGEALPPGVIERHWRTLPHARLYNEYGPTEATVFATVHELTQDTPEQPVPIGTPIAHCDCWVLDTAGHLAPIGHSGELYIGGAGVASGYHNRPAETARRFVNRALAEDGESTAVYRTGDRCRYREDGVLEYLGRVDDQVQIRGHRVEIGEIEAALCSLPGVADAAVALRHGDRGDARLVAFLVLEKIHDFELNVLIGSLRERLPGYMVPTTYSAVPSLPHNTNGKVDRGALAELPVTPLATRASTVPQSALEHQLVAIFEELIGAVGISSTDNFFDQGGHSLLAVQAIELIERRTGVRLSIANFARNPTARGIARFIEGRASAPPSARCIEIIHADGDCVPLVFVGSVAQARSVAKHLAPTRKVLGLNLFGLHEPGKVRAIDIDWIVERYLAELRSMVPSGPYAIGGYCDDAKVAVAMAEKLRASGEDVRLLVLVDALFYLEHKLVGAAGKVSSSKPPALTKNRASAKWIRHRFERLVKYGLDDLRRAMAGRELGLRKRLGLPLPLTLEHSMLFHNYRSALDAYAAPVPEDRVALYVSEEWGLSEDHRSRLRGFDIRVVPGFHETMFEASSLETLAAAIEHDLNAADALDSTPKDQSLYKGAEQRLAVLLPLFAEMISYASAL